MFEIEISNIFLIRFFEAREPASTQAAHAKMRSEIYLAMDAVAFRIEYA
jgi:hypothetical protein